jgi:hypothetical protein
VRELIVRVSCFVADLLLGAPRQVVTAAEEQELALARAGDPYFDAFRHRCIQWVYGHDPRREDDA